MYNNRCAQHRDWVDTLGGISAMSVDILKFLYVPSSLTCLISKAEWWKKHVHELPLSEVRANRSSYYTHPLSSSAEGVFS